MEAVRIEELQYIYYSILKEVYYAHKGCIYLIKYTVKNSNIVKSY